MNTLGKLMILLIFLMSILFMTFSFMVFMTQTAWNAKAKTAQSDLQTQQQKNRQLQTQMKELELQMAGAKAARTNAIATLETSLASSDADLNRTRKLLGDLQAEQQLQGKQVTGSLATLQTERKKVDSLRETLNTVVGERDKIFAELISLRNSVLELEATRDNLTAREADLLDKVARLSAIIRANDLNENDDISGLPPTQLAGKVKQVGPNNKMVLVNLGEDDGMRRGHFLDIHRQEKYLGRIRLTKTYPDRAVGRVVDGYQLAAIRSGDDVRTK